VIIQPFDVRSKGKRFDFVDVDALDSEADIVEANRRHGAALAYVQTAALCENRGLTDGDLRRKSMAVFDGGVIVGIWLLGCIEYVSGPWADVVNWDLTNPGEDAILSAVPMSGMIRFDGNGNPIPTMLEDDEADLAAETALKLVTTPNSLLSGQGTPVGFERLHYGVFKQHDDPISRRAQAHHNKARAHPQLDVTELPDPANPTLTLVTIRKR
jgi:hypothetical protein